MTRRPATPEEIFVREETEAELDAALAKLPAVQARRIFAHYILGMKKVDIARAEGVCDRCVCGSIKTGLANLKKILKETMYPPGFGCPVSRLLKGDKPASG